MDQHPVPRNVTGFQFQLIGSMTVKQFGYLLTGIILGFVFFKLPLSFFRFPLAGVCGFIGFALAFLPIQERPLDIWIVNFVKSMYLPTQFIWRKESVVPDFLAAVPHTKPTLRQTTQVAQHYDARNKLTAYLQTIAPKEHQLLDEREKLILATVNTQFSQPILTTYRATQPTVNPQPAATTQTPLGGIGLVSGIAKVGANPIAGILITIKDQTGKPVRLLKTNIEGKFGSHIPLPPGIYEASFEDANKQHHIDSFKFQITSSLFVPWLINAQNIVMQTN